MDNLMMQTVFIFFVSAFGYCNSCFNSALFNLRCIF